MAVVAFLLGSGLERYDGARPQSKHTVNVPRDDCPAREIAGHDASVRSIRLGQNDLHEILLKYLKS
jgi:hypothetical protein